MGSHFRATKSKWLLVLWIGQAALSSNADWQKCVIVIERRVSHGSLVAAQLIRFVWIDDIITSNIVAELRKRRRLLLGLRAQCKSLPLCKRVNIVRLCLTLSYDFVDFVKLTSTESMSVGAYSSTSESMSERRY